jgi:hypothetical protein
MLISHMKIYISEKFTLKQLNLRYNIFEMHMRFKQRHFSSHVIKRVRTRHEERKNVMRYVCVQVVSSHISMPQTSLKPVVFLWGPLLQSINCIEEAYVVIVVTL